MKKQDIIEIALIFLAVILSFSMGYLVRDHILNPDNPFQFTQTHKVTCCNSMYPLIQNGDDIVTKPFDGKAECGHIYSYQYNKTKRFSHRFIYEDNGTFYFKGDNNKDIDSPINISQIKEEVIGVFHNESFRILNQNTN